MAPTTVLILDHQPVFRKGLRAVLDEQDGAFAVIGEASDGQEGLLLATTHEPDVILLGAECDGLQGLALIRTLKQRLPGTGIIVVDASGTDETLFYAVKYGAAAYLARTAALPTVLETVCHVAAGQYLINETILQAPDLARQLLDDFRDLARDLDEQVEPLFIPLSVREVEVLDYIAKGNSNKEIARHMGISDQTVKNHITSIMRKLAVNDRTQAVVHALRHGWITA